MAFELIKRIFRLNKLPTLVTFVSAIIAFALSLVVLLSNGTAGQLSQYNMMMLNTSTLLQNAVKVESAASTTVKRAVLPRATPPPSLEERFVAVERGLISDASTFFAGLSPTATSGLAASATAAFGAATSVIGSALGNLGTLAGQEVEKVVNEVVEDVLDTLGIQQYYTLYMMEFCGGKFVPNYADPNAKMNVTSCTKYSDVAKLLPNSTSNSTLTIGQTRLDFSALNFPAKLSGAGGTLTSILTLLFAFQVIGVVSTGLLILICPLSLLLAIFNGSIVRGAMFALAVLATASLSIVAGVLTAVPVAAGAVINKLAGDLGAQAHTGGRFIAMMVVSSVLMGVSAGLWAVQVFDSVFQRRSSAVEGEKVGQAGSLRLKIGAPVIVKTPREAYYPSQETGTIRSV